MLPFQIIEPTLQKVPIVISIPHCGVKFPKELNGHFDAQKLANLDDTDFFVDKLYDFVSELGITIIHSIFHRWVIDLNRSPQNNALYNDGRIITSLTPITDFLGEKIYVNKSFEPDENEIERRKQLYYYPYYAQLNTLLKTLKNKKGQVLLWDAHSIRQQVLTIQKTNFPDLILGNNDKQTASQFLIKDAINNLSNNGYKVAHNKPFKGGNITRSFGHPSKGVHALQLEMTKILYMNDRELQYNPTKAEKVIKMLRKTFKSLIKTMNNERISL